MKTKAFLSASRIVALVLACVISIGFDACGSDDDKPSVNDLLSDKTTPVTFELDCGDYYVFDYSGSSLVGSDTMHVEKSGKYDVNLRQGNHHIIWISLGDNQNQYFPQWTMVEDGPFFDTSTRRILHAVNNSNLGYGTTDIEVSSYLLPIQKVEIEKITTCLKIEATDKLPYEPYYDGNYLFQGIPGSMGKDLYYIGYVFDIGTFTGLYPVKSISADNGSCIIDSESRSITVGSEVVFFNESPKYYFAYDAFSPKVIMLCPKDGLNNIQLETEIKEQSGRIVPTTTLPKFSLRRGYTTALRGPLFSGSATDWVVTMEPYGE